MTTHDESTLAPNYSPVARSTLRPWGSRIVSLASASAGLVILAVLPLFVAFSSTQIKYIFDQFTGGCALVLDKSEAPDGKIFVSGRISGTMPNQLPLIFEGRDALINSISFESPYRMDQIREPDDLTYHPLAGQDCPGSLCDQYGETLERRSVGITLGDIKPEFAYRFLVRVQPVQPDHAVQSSFTASTDNLKVYALYSQGFQGQVCRVEPRRWFNFWVWATPLKKAALFIFVIVGSGLLLKWAKKKEGSSS